MIESWALSLALKWIFLIAVITVVDQLCDYLDIHGLDRGYLLVFDFNNNKEFKEERINIIEKEIFQVYV